MDRVTAFPLSRAVLGALLLLALTLLPINPLARAASDWYVTPTGAGDKNGTSLGQAFDSLQDALDVAQPGDTIHLGPGDYYEAVETKTHGASGNPITITGPNDAVLRGTDDQGRVFQVFHDHYVLDGFTINGYDGVGDAMDDYRDKLLYVHGQTEPYGGEVRRGPQGLEVRNMAFLNAGGECIRLRYFVRYAAIHHNSIRNCGMYDFVFDDGGKNGEGIYIGTSSNQWDDGKNPTADPDGSSYNYIHHNIIDTQGNECVEVKEGGTRNIVEHNDCTGGKDENAAGLVSRGDGNTFRYNTTHGHAGGGIRFGGHTVAGHDYGVANDAYGNVIYDNALGGIKFEGTPQGTICGNIFTGPQGQTQARPAFGSYGDEYTDQVATPCSFAIPAHRSDVDWDGDVDIADVMTVAGVWRAERGEPQYRQYYDLYHDGRISVVDIMRVALHWGEMVDIGPRFPLGYSPYRPGQAPGGLTPSPLEIGEDMDIVEQETKLIRTYGACDEELAIIPGIANGHGMNVYQGVELTATPSLNDQEMDCFATLVAEHQNIVAGVIGNETLLSGALSETDLIDYIEQAKVTGNVPVTTGEPWNVWCNGTQTNPQCQGRPDLGEAVDFILAHSYPYWENVPIEHGAAHVVATYITSRAVYTDRVVVIGETGWPTCGDPRDNAVPSLENQRRFIEELWQWAHLYNMPVFYFEALDEGSSFTGTG